MRMALLAEKLPASEALAAGLVSSVHAADELDAEVDRVLATLKSGPAVALRKTKQAINDATLTELNNTFARETAGQDPAFARRRLPRGRGVLPAAADSRLLGRVANGSTPRACKQITRSAVDALWTHSRGIMRFDGFASVQPGPRFRGSGDLVAHSWQ